MWLVVGDGTHVINSKALAELLVKWPDWARADERGRSIGKSLERELQDRRPGEWVVLGGGAYAVRLAARFCP